MKRTLFFVALAVLSLSLIMPRKVVADGGATLLAHWQMDEGSGTFLADSSGNGFDGTLISGTWVENRFSEAGKAISLNNQRIDIPDDAKAQTVTLSAWINPTRYGTISSPGCIFSSEKGSGASGFVWRLALIENGILRLEAVAPYSTSTQRYALSSVSVPLNEWHHVGGTYDGLTVKVYLDGQLVGSTEYSTEALLNTSSAVPSTIGYMSWGLQYFGGAIDDARIYDGVLSDTEIAVLADNEFIPLSIVVNQNKMCFVGRIISIDLIDLINTVKLQYSVNDGTNWNDIDSGVYTAGPVYWKIPEGIDSNTSLIRAISTDESYVYAQSDLFSIRPCSVTADLDGNCFTDMRDLAILANEWLSGENW